MLSPRSTPPKIQPNMFRQALNWMRVRSFENQIKHRAETNEFNALGPPIYNVRTRNEELRFFDHADAVHWATSNKVPLKNIEKRQHRYIKTSTVAWLNEQFSNGMAIRNHADLIASVQKENVDDAIRWFNNVNWAGPKVAHALLQVAFSANRPDAIAAIVDWTQTSPYSWFTPTKMSGPKHDVWANAKDSEDSACLFARLIRTPLLMDWLLTNAPTLKKALVEPTQWARIVQAVNDAPAEIQAFWPLVLKTVFSIDASPLDFPKVWSNPFHTEQLYASFEHSPAAQSTIAYWRIKQGPWYKKVHYTSYNDEVSMFYGKMKALAGGENLNALPSTPLVDQLMVGVHLDLSPEDFYVHAQNVFRQCPAPQETLPNMDASLFV